MKIRNIIVQLIAIVAILTTGYSCSDDFYTEQSGNRITPEQHYNSQDDLASSILGTYRPLQDGVPKLLLIDGLRSDLMDVTDQADVYMKEINEHNFSLTNPYIDASDLYKTIVNANEIIKNMDKVWASDPPDPRIPHQPKYEKGLLYNIKAMCYFNLARLYGKAALINDNMSSLDPTQNILSKKDIIDTMINQLKPYVFNSTSSTLREIYFGFGPNTKTLIGEMYLENKNYDSAIYYLKLGMESYENNSNLYKVSKLGKEAWKTIFYDDANLNAFEVIDVLRFDSKKDQFNNFTGWTLERKVKPTQILMDNYNGQIPTGKGTGDVYRGLGVTFDKVEGTNDYYISKYNLVKGEPYSAYIVLSRAADLHLLLAEAYNQLGDTSMAMAFINGGIKTKRPTPLGYNKWTNNIGVRGRVSLFPRTIAGGLSGDALKNAVEDAIIEERMLELAYEGKRWFDLVRIAERRGDPSFLAGKVASKFSDENKRAEIYGKLMNPANWYLPSK